MLIDITRLKSGIDELVKLDQTLQIDFSNSEIIEGRDLKISGNITKDREGYYIDAIVSGIIVLPSSITLNPVDVSFTTEIVGNIEEMLAEIGESEKKAENTIDIFPIIWENILMEIPMRVVGSDEEQTMEGDGWRIITDSESVSTNPELQKLKDLLK